MTFNAAGSTAPGGVLRYGWRFNDGTSSEETVGPTVSHTFPTAGAHLVALTVFAGDGTSIGSAGLIVTGDEGPGPALSIATATPTAAQPVSFNGSGSTDSDGSITSYEWNFGDGSPVGTGAAPSHTYAAVGTYMATLLVGDSSGQIATISHPVVVDEAPAASFSMVPASSTAGQPVSFDGSASADTDGSIASYNWNFGDGGAPGSGSTASHIYGTAGTYTVTLTVIDTAGATSATSQQATVVAAPPGPTAALTTTTAAAVALPVTPNSSFTASGAALNQKTGAIKFTESFAEPGTFSWLVTFPNGKFGAFASSNTKCKAGFIKLSGKCRPAKIVFAKGTKTVTAAGTVIFTLKPSASALKALKNALKQGKGLPVTATLRFQSSLGGSPVSHTQSLMVKLKKK
jgi:PKD repeat protein